MQNDAEKIVQLLSAHRQTACPALPRPISFRQLVSLFQAAARPDAERSLEAGLRETLAGLEAEGEVFSGPGGRWVVSPPAAITEKEELLSGGLLFRGDRSYLALARRAVDCQNRELSSRRLQPQERRFHHLQARLSQVGVRLLTVEDLTLPLTVPQAPGAAALEVLWPCDPFGVTNWPDDERVERYSPAPRTTQRERWRYPGREDLRNRDLLRLPTGEYLWYEDNQFFELAPETAQLAMFRLDQEASCPLEVWWDRADGLLHLHNLFLPRSYARIIWQCSEPVEERPRVRLVQPLYHSIIEKALSRLGCQIV